MEPKLVVGAARVYDDFLPSELSQRIFHMMNAIPYSRTDSQQWLKVWTLADGVILRSNQWEASGPHWLISEHGNPGNKDPAPEPLPEFLMHLLELLKEHPDLPLIKHVVMVPYVWPPKSSISWHKDGATTISNRVGAFTYYVHRYWNAEWGGEFLLSEVDSNLTQRPFDNSEVSAGLISRGHGVWISPKPNRILINPSDMYHKVAKSTEGASPRLSIQGFLYT